MDGCMSDHCKRKAYCKLFLSGPRGTLVDYMDINMCDQDSMYQPKATMGFCGKCPHECSYKGKYGYCNYTECINKEHGGVDRGELE